MSTASLSTSALGSWATKNLTHDFASSSSSAQASTSKLQPEQQLASVASRLYKINTMLQDADPEEIIEWAIDNLPGLYQTTAFGLTGCVTLDQISQVSKRRQSPTHLVPLIFIDTLYHFPQTIDLAHRAAAHYNAPMHIIKPEGCDSTTEFEDKYGRELWKRDESSYDYLVKVEPAQRAYSSLGVRAVFTGRRRSQGAERASLNAVEIDETGLIKVNAFLNWSFAQVNDYAKAHNVPYNELLDFGYRSVGDWHSTEPTAEGAGDEAERGGRWKGQVKRECGLHRMGDTMRAAKVLREATLARNDASRGDGIELSKPEAAAA
ncbi:3'-phosphoadenylsulfate reductase [Tilletia horrida]|uniref:3'-phosphoadenylsulfate reductase n=1 Tax=Tilletia horrida TaxID=155126 RepID=A0AAN6GU84_9BASI|nr:3'-phosphoadenylsulfate reductase [Tilletia horrida]KAK0556139.1 3'-phosphoadenylsulfate reductase [Tilletia horrida]KAK0569065.1 3'-phosphoadenylsulfate reductase [Tilletia horrida]